MSVIANLVKPSFYMDSVALMRFSREIADKAGVEDAALMMGTPANLRIMADADILGVEGEAASSGDLVIAIRATSDDVAKTVISEAEDFLDQPARQHEQGEAWQPRTLRAGLKRMPDANLALVSVPGDYAAAEARKALSRGLNVMMFSDNVSIQAEIALKQQAREAGLLLMGPDCGTAIINGVPLAFANQIPRGDIGIIGASGTGIQEVTCQIAKLGKGVSEAIGVGGRDLKAEIGGTTTLMALDLLDADPETTHIVIVSKPPASTVASRIINRIAQSSKHFTVCFVGGDPVDLPPNAKLAPTLRDAARMAVGLDPIIHNLDGDAEAERPVRERTEIRGLFAGGTLCSEAQMILKKAGLSIASNVPIAGVQRIAPDVHGIHQLIDLGDDGYTQGRPHPMIDPSVRDQTLADALHDSDVGVVLLDLVLGYGSHLDPAGHMAAVLEQHAADGRLIIASVIGTDQDPQSRAAQVAKIERVGVKVAPSNADAVALALNSLSRRP